MKTDKETGNRNNQVRYVIKKRLVYRIEKKIEILEKN